MTVKHVWVLSFTGKSGRKKITIAKNKDMEKILNAARRLVWISMLFSERYGVYTQFLADVAEAEKCENRKDFEKRAALYISQNPKYRIRIEKEIHAMKTHRKKVAAQM